MFDGLGLIVAKKAAERRNFLSFRAPAVQGRSERAPDENILGPLPISRLLNCYFSTASDPIPESDQML